MSRSTRRNCLLLLTLAFAALGVSACSLNDAADNQPIVETGADSDSPESPEVAREVDEPDPPRSDELLSLGELVVAPAPVVASGSPVACEDIAADIDLRTTASAVTAISTASEDLERAEQVLFDAATFLRTISEASIQTPAFDAAEALDAFSEDPTSTQNLDQLVEAMFSLETVVEELCEFGP